jgi:hypothetical protein
MSSDLLSRKNMARLAWRATKFVTHWGFNLARRGARRGIERVKQRNQEDVKNETIDGEYKLREWRVWSAQSDKAEQPKTERVSWGSKK